MPRATEKSKARSSSASRSIGELHRDYLDAQATLQAVPPHRPIDRAVAHCDRIAGRIFAAPAQSLGDVLLKIKLAADFFEQGNETDLLLSLQDDLARLRQRAPGAGLNRALEQLAV